ncbi:hypothetical protein Csp1_19870 [Corynebacterium provencense]|uniref:DUF4365 domain-containing protein n=1 Tax=Corynebacterium provencense TaxID=1737425 RepID=A0A2Z3YNC0_9CORY|nr:DUF4365 domain-containing protein [Corynebacterium provencense]AWT26755.1 hypothetical protein Csp1_19870 [Corynebacterium provencense]
MSAMRAPGTEATGTAGQSFVKSQFESLGWGPVPNPEHDVGTDIWIAARDSRRFDVRALVGAQVKSGPSYFNDPETEDNTVTGWWYRDDKDHFEYWTEHKVPHLLILHDDVEKVSYWTHVTADKVVSTGKGAKILVPIDSIIGDDSADDLLAIATSSPNIKEWEGSAWKLGHSVPESSQIRYALITPRLIAPHGNSSVQELSAAQAIALLVQLRLREIQMHQKKGSLIDPVSAAESTDINWRLYAGLYQWIVSGKSESLLTLDSRHEPDYIRAAIAVCAASALFDNGEPREGLAIVESLLAEDVVNPVDDGWLRAHRMRCLMEIGRLREAHDESAYVHSLRSVAPDDPTARAFAGVGSLVVLNTGEFFDQSAIAEAVQNGDNLASWWRSQTFVAALEKQTNESFKSWGNDTSVTIGADDVVGNRLLSTMLIAGFMADNYAWKSSANLLYTHRLMLSGTDADIATDCLIRLTRIGADKEIKLAVRRLLAFGPVAAVSRASNDVNLSALSRSSLKSTLVLLRISADVLSESLCDTYIRWALDELTGRSAVSHSLEPRFLVSMQIIETLASVVRGCSEDARESVRRHILELSPVEDQTIAHEYASVIKSIDSDLWSTVEIAKLAEREGDNFELHEAIEQLVATRDPEFRKSLVSRITAGEFAALVGYGDLKDLPLEAASGMIDSLAERVTNQTAEARRGAYTIGTQDPINALVLLNALFPSQAQWEPFVEALREEQSSGDDLTEGLRTLAFHADSIPADVRSSICNSLKRLSSVTPEGGFGGWTGMRSDTRGAAALATSALFPGEFSDTDLAQLVQGSASQRAAAVQIIGTQEETNHLALLSMLANDDDVNVRRTAAHFLARWVLRGVGSNGSVEVLKHLIENSGVRIATAASDALTDLDDRHNIAALIDILRDSPSSYVRKRIIEAEQA